MKMDVRSWSRWLFEGLILVGIVSGGAWLVRSRSGSAANGALIQLAASRAKLTGLVTVERRARADLAQVREARDAHPEALCPEQARDAEAAISAAQAAVDLMPTALGLATTASQEAQTAASHSPALAGSHQAAAGLLSAQAAAEATQTAMDATHAAVIAAQAAADRRQALTAPQAAAAAFAAAQTAVDAAQTTTDAAVASRVALSHAAQPSATL